MWLDLYVYASLKRSRICMYYYISILFFRNHYIYICSTEISPCQCGFVCNGAPILFGSALSKSTRIGCQRHILVFASMVKPSSVKPKPSQRHMYCMLMSDVYNSPGYQHKDMPPKIVVFWCSRSSGIIYIYINIYIYISIYSIYHFFSSHGGCIL